jgi:hypothetical protein
MVKREFATFHLLAVGLKYSYGKIPIAATQQEDKFILAQLCVRRVPEFQLTYFAGFAL